MLNVKKMLQDTYTIKSKSDPDVSFEVRKLKVSEYSNIVNKATKKSMVKLEGSKQKQLVSNIDVAYFNKEIFLRAVVGWSGLTTDGEVFECNDTNKEWLVENVQGIVVEVVNEIVDLINEESTLELGN